MQTAFDEHVRSQAEVVRGLLAEEGPRGLVADRPLVLTGIGTSLHACRVAAHWVALLSGGRVRATVVDAHDLAVQENLRPADQVVVVSHRGNKQRTNEVLRLAARVGATSVAVSGLGPDLPDADVVVRTCAQERASTHTVSFVAALVQLGRMVADAVGESGEPLLRGLAAVPDALEHALGLPVSEALVDDVLRTAPHPLLVTGTGADGVVAAEVALKFKEAVYRWAEGMHTEFALHGTPAVFSHHTVGMLIRPATDDRGRTDELAAFLRELGAPVHLCGPEEGASLRIPASVPDLVRPLVTPVPFQLLVSRLATELGTSPDKTHLEAEPWASAFAAVTL